MEKFKYSFRWFYLFCSVFVAMPALAADSTLYVVDQNLETQAQNTYNFLSNQIYKSINQNTRATNELNANVQKGLIGANGSGVFYNPTAEQAFRNWTPTADDLNNMVSQGLQTGSLADRIKYYNEKFKTSNPAANSEYAVFSTTSTNAALAVADNSFDRVIQVQQQINYLYQQLDRQQTLKQSQDFNSVIMLKIAALQTDMIRLQAQQLKIQAVSQQENNTRQITMNQFVEDIK